MDLKTSLFEAVKNSFVTAVQSDPNVSKVKQRKIVKAKTNNAGDADVEYIFEVTLTKDGTWNNFDMLYNKMLHSSSEKRYPFIIIILSKAEKYKVKLLTFLSRSQLRITWVYC